MQVWYWRYWNQLPYLSCSLLADWPHGFFTRQFDAQMPAELVKVLDPQATAARSRQVHGNRILTELPTQPPFPEADGLMATAAGTSVWVCTADCTPVLMGDRQRGVVAAIHAGWRGTAAQIVPRAIAGLQQQGSSLEDLRFALGPAIGGSVYQVSVDVAAQVCATLNPAATDAKTMLATWGVRERVPFSSPVVLADATFGKMRLDIRQAIATQIVQCGIRCEQIAIAPYCTYQTSNYFFSYRRSGQSQVQWSGIVARPFPP
jgi:hypothetical protein